MKKKILPAAVSLLIILCLISCSGALETRESSIYKKGEVENCRIISDTAAVKSGAGENFTTIATLNDNEIVDVIGSLQDWYVVSLQDNQVGCIDAAKARPVVREEKNNKNSEEDIEEDQPPRQIDEEPEAQPEEDITPAENLTSLEEQMITRVNEERKKEDLPPLDINRKLTKVARLKAKDMVDNDYFSHYSPTYGSPFDMLDRAGISYTQAAENIAGNSTVSSAHNSLMNSSGHKKNILNPDFTDIGVGVKTSDKYGYIFVQLFISQPR